LIYYNISIFQVLIIGNLIRM